MKGFFQFLRDIKIKYKLGLIFAVMIYITVNSWFLSFTSISDVQDSFLKLSNEAIPTLEATISMKDNIERSYIAAYDYILTGNQDSKQRYEDRFKDAISNELDLFEVGFTEEDFEFTQDFNDQLISVNNNLDALVAEYEKDPNAHHTAGLDAKLNEANEAKNTFLGFVDNEISRKVTEEIDSANSQIEKTANRITLYLIIVLAATVLIIIFLIIFLSSNITRPINKLIKAAELFGKGDFIQVEVKRNDELGVFANTFNKMAVDIDKTQKALARELEKTKELDAMKSEFVSFAAHQLRTPMSGVRWTIDMFESGDLGKMTAEQNKFLGRAKENTDRMVKLIDSLLRITEIEQQEFQYDFKKVDYLKIVKEVIAELANQSEKREIKVSVQMEKGLKTELTLDAEKIKMLLSNLIDNAIKYSHPKGEVIITLEKNGNFLLTKVIDEGLGIPEAAKKKIFTKFFRADNILKYETQGAGLGVYIAKDIVDKHHGNIGFESEENKGTTFYFTLPYVRKTKTG
ncbi:MCP four helix bundle domain-containing protein [Patescibacteria group bacterium]|nr:MCP four helix bundle domain-containing protein [Patescibacteria group bacterium]MBU1673858.1 MCP four helix bundle domain-containing protein [Patescibacteria group bacterium]MBU1963235.1 MCP four helix bundle domain-containing protein [Patescibacteria group bacterium]